MKRFLILLSFLPFFGKSQFFEGEREYYSEIIWGINKNTNSGVIGGLVVGYGRFRGKDVSETYSLELSNVKHPDEVRRAGVRGRSFTYGKSNYLYAVRLRYGREKLMFRKGNQQGVQISAGSAVGPTIGLVVPYYVLNLDGTYEPFDPGPAGHTSPESIAGPGKFLQGLNQARWVPGLNLTSSLSFEFGAYKNNAAGIEVGIMLEAYTKKIIIVPTQPNKSVFTSIFLTLFWGTRK